MTKLHDCLLILALCASLSGCSQQPAEQETPEQEALHATAHALKESEGILAIQAQPEPGSLEAEAHGDPVTRI